SYKPSFQEEVQGNQGDSLERSLLCKAREQIQLKRLRRRRISGISDAIKAEHRQLRRISIDFHQASSIEIPEDPVAKLGQQVDTRSKQVDTSPRFQKGRSTLAQGRSTLDPVSSRPVLQKWDSRSTLDLGRSTHSGNSVT
ncbi:hypothetical protein Taro_009920, partial [Colocasia esculenta]|nr:hypothetical protein [Colocasia esculenta]